MKKMNLRLFEWWSCNSNTGALMQQALGESNAQALIDEWKDESSVFIDVIYETMDLVPKNIWRIYERIFKRLKSLKPELTDTRGKQAFVRDVSLKILRDGNCPIEVSGTGNVMDMVDYESDDKEFLEWWMAAFEEWKAFSGKNI